jgi:type II secretory pathway pseudopilin PulG
MVKPIPIRRHHQPAEDGYILVVVMFLLATLILALAVAAPIVKKDLQRDRDIETMHRGKQYARAIKLYYKKFGAYPPSVDALVNTNMVRFLRKKYVDPTTGKDEWKIIHVGQNKLPTAWGFFGVPLNGAAITGGLCGNALPGSTPSSPGSSSGSSMFSSGSSGTGFGSSPAGTGGCPNTSTTSTDQNAANANATNANTANGANSNSTSGTGLNGQTFGGGPIMGVSPASPKQSILLYHKMNHYKDWEFVYDPLAEQMMQQGMQGGNLGNNGLGGNPGAGVTPGIGGNPSPGGNPSGNPPGGGVTPPPATQQQ